MYSMYMSSVYHSMYLHQVLHDQTFSDFALETILTVHGEPQ